MQFTSNRLKLTFADTYRSLASMTFEGRELLTPEQAPLFAIRLRD